MLLRYGLWSPLAVIALAVAALGVTQNARYGAWLDAASGSQTATIFGIALGGFGITFAVLNSFKVISLPAIIEAWRQGSRGIATICAVGFIGLAALSIWNVTALQTIARDDKGARQEIERQRLADLKAELAEVEARASALGEARLTGEIEAALAAMRVDRRWSSSNECRDATAQGSRTFCADYHREFAELTRANHVEQSRTKIERLRNEIAQRTTVGAVQLADPELKRLADATGFDAATVGWWRALVFAMIFELVEAFALALAWVVRPRNTATPSKGRSLPPPGEPLPRLDFVAAETTCPEGNSRALPKPVPPLDEPALEPAPTAAKSGAKSGASVATKPALRLALRLVTSAAARDARTAPGQDSTIEPGQAVAAFVATLSRSASARVTGGELLSAYECARQTRGWPELTATAFGRQLKRAITKAGGRKVKSNGQQVYVGFALRAHAAEGAA